MYISTGWLIFIIVMIALMSSGEGGDTYAGEYSDDTGSDDYWYDDDDEGY